MNQQVSVIDENHMKIGMTFPKRAKQLVKRGKAKWLGEPHTEIELIQEQALEQKGVNDTADVIDLREKHLVKDAYRDSIDIVLHSSPIEIIKKSKRRTRELHAAFSAVLWAGAAIFYFGLNYVMGNRVFTLRPADISWTWLIFMAAALVECSAEIYFCGKELAVLNENIDLRQVNPNKGGDFDLFNYQKSLTGKIKVMTTAAIWVPLVICYFAAGYLFQLWGVAWIIFVLGAFLELVRNFVKKLKNA